MMNKSNIINLNSYIRISSIEKQFEESCLFVSGGENIDEVFKYTNIIFESPKLKNEFFEYLTLNGINHTIINCLSSTEIFEQTLWDARGMVVFDNVCSCRNNEILEMVINYKKKKMLVC